MKSILCYGDSNTWGASPRDWSRMERNKRWPGVLRNILGNGYEVVEEGLCGRTTVWDDPIEGYKSGKEYLIPCLDSHNPLDLVIFLLGTNDLKHRFSLTSFDIAKGAGVLIDMVKNSRYGRNEKALEVLLICPPPLGKLNYFSEMFRGGAEKSKELSKFFEIEARELKCYFLDAGKVIVSSDSDGIHFDEAEHAKLGKVVSEIVLKIL